MTERSPPRTAGSGSSRRQWTWSPGENKADFDLLGEGGGKKPLYPIEGKAAGRGKAWEYPGEGKAREVDVLVSSAGAGAGRLRAPLIEN